MDSSTKEEEQDHRPVLEKEMDIFAKQKYNLEDHVTVWSDFLGTHFHPKSIHIVQEYHHKDELRHFDLFNSSNEVLSNYECTCEWEDRIHYFIEECDNLQGFHVLMDTHDGFGGLGAALVRHLADEFPGKGILTFGFTPADVPDDTAYVRANRIINSALAYENVSTHSSLFVPSSLAKGLWRTLQQPREFPYLKYKSTAYHTSAILASALDTATLPYRLEVGAMNIRDITHSFNSQGRKISTLNASFPLGIYEGESLVDYFTHHGDQFSWQPLTPHVTNEKLPFMESVVLRGVTDEMVASKTDPRKLLHHLIGARSKEEVLRNYLEHKSSGNLFTANCVQSPVKTAVPFPQMFHENISCDGFVTSYRRSNDRRVDSVPVMTSLQSTPAAGEVIQHLYEAAAKMNIKKHHRYMSAGLEQDDYEEVLANLKALAANYNTDVDAL